MSSCTGWPAKRVNRLAHLLGCTAEDVLARPAALRAVNCAGLRASSLGGALKPKGPAPLGQSIVGRALSLASLGQMAIFGTRTTLSQLRHCHHQPKAIDFGQMYSGSAKSVPSLAKCVRTRPKSYGLSQTVYRPSPKLGHDV